MKVKLFHLKTGIDTLNSWSRLLGLNPSNSYQSITITNLTTNDTLHSKECSVPDKRGVSGQKPYKRRVNRLFGSTDSALKSAWIVDFLQQIELICGF